MAEPVGETATGATNDLLLIAALGAVAFVVGNVTRRWVSEVIVFLAIGIVVGPAVLDIVDADTVVALEPVTSLALGAIVFGIGERLEIPRLRRQWHTLAWVSLLENAGTFALVFFGTLLVRDEFGFAFLLAAIAISTSPTTLVAVIAERRARGGFTDNLLSATAINNVVSAAVFGLGLPLVLAARTDAGQGALAFVQLIVYSVIIGTVGALILRRWQSHVTRVGERLLFVSVVLVSIVAVSRAVDAPVVLSALVAGAVLANDRRDTEPLFEALRTLEAPIFLVFFLVAGAGVHFDELATVPIIVGVYVVARTVGKVGGSWVGLEMTRSGRRTGWGRSFGGGLLPFAGMAIGLAAFTLERATQAGLPDLGSDVSSAVIGSVVVFELLGPIAVGRALDDAGESGRDESEGNGEAPHLIRHILVPLSSPEMARAKGAQIVDLAASAGAAVTGLHVIAPGTTTDETLGDPALSLVGQIAATRNVQFEAVVREADDVVEAIAAEARRAAVDVVVLGETAPEGESSTPSRAFIHAVIDRLDPTVRVMVIPTIVRSAAPVTDSTSSSA